MPLFSPTLPPTFEPDAALADFVKLCEKAQQKLQKLDQLALPFHRRHLKRWLRGKAWHPMIQRDLQQASEGIAALAQTIQALRVHP